MDQNTCVAVSHCSQILMSYMPFALLFKWLCFSRYCQIAKENLYIESIKTVPNWTTGKVLASPTSVPAHHCVHNQGCFSMLHSHQAVAHIWTWLQQACYFMVFFFLFLEWDFLRGQAEDVISLKLDQLSPGWFWPTSRALCHRFPQPTQPVLTLTSWWSGMSKKVLWCWDACIQPSIHCCWALWVCSLCSFPHCAAL